MKAKDKLRKQINLEGKGEKIKTRSFLRRTQKAILEKAFSGGLIK